MEAQPIAELDVLIGVAGWLNSHGWRIERVSLARGQGIDQASGKQELESSFTGLGIPLEGLRFTPSGADIEAVSGTDVWRIECKGLGNVKASTLKNNFDRAVASVVSYYERSERLRLGLAIPEQYLQLIQAKLPLALREIISLWIFLYVNRDEIYVFSPTEELP